MATNVGRSANSRVLKILKNLKASDVPEDQAPTADDYLAQEGNQAPPQPGPEDQLLPEAAPPVLGAPQPGPEAAPLEEGAPAVLPEDVRRSRARAGAFPRRRAQ